MTAPSREGTIVAAGHALEYVWHAGDAARPVMVFLHEGLGCATLWRDVPATLAAETGSAALVYSRHGYGGSDPLSAPFQPDYMHREALEALPEVLDAFAIERPVLIGHSDGASIALIHAGRSGRAIAGLVLEAPHVMVEDISIDGIEEARRLWESTDLPRRLAKYHRDAERTFRGWNDIWLDARFRDWSIVDVLDQVAVPVLAIQGADDEYGTLAQLDAIEQGISGGFERLVLERCRHTPHRDRRDAVLPAIAAFVRALEE